MKKKLSSIEKPSDFAKAIIEGADVNDTIKGKPLIRYYLSEAMRYVSKCDKQNEFFTKFTYLLSAGADVSPIIGPSSPFDENGEEYKILVGRILIQLELLTALLQTQSVKDAILENELYWKRQAKPQDCFDETTFDPTEDAQTYLEENSRRAKLFDGITKEEAEDLIEIQKSENERRINQIKEENECYLKPLIRIFKLLKEIQSPIIDIAKKFEEEV